MTGATRGAGTTYLSEHLNFSWVRIVRSPVFCVMFLDRCLSSLSVGHCIVCLSSIYVF